MLGDCSVPLVDRHDLVMLDLDGVVYVGPDPVPGAPAAIARLRQLRRPIAFVTNNAARTPTQVAAHLSSIGIPSDPVDVVTAAQAAARLLRTRLGPGGRVFLAGGDGLAAALADEDLVAVTDPDDHAEAVVTGFGPDLAWLRIVQAAVLIRQGLPWVASNTDATYPMALGEAPGHGALVKLLADFSGFQPVVAGKPQPPLFDETLRRIGGGNPIVVGDRLDTDIAGAHAVGLPSLLVLTGVTGLAELVRAAPGERPTYVGLDLSALFCPHPAPDQSGQLDGWRATVEQGVLRMQGDGSPDAWWRLAVTTAWRHLDSTGEPVDTRTVERARPVAPGSVTP